MVSKAEKSAGMTKNTVKMPEKIFSGFEKMVSASEKILSMTEKIFWEARISSG